MIKRTINTLASDTIFYEKLNLLDQVNNSSQLLQGMFNSNKAGRDETKIYISLIEELLERWLLIEDFIEITKLQNMVKENKMFWGITIS